MTNEKKKKNKQKEERRTKGYICERIECLRQTQYEYNEMLLGG